MLKTSLITTQLMSVKDSFHVEKQATCYICIYLILIKLKCLRVYSFIRLCESAIRISGSLWTIAEMTCSKEVVFVAPKLLADSEPS